MPETKQTVRATCYCCHCEFEAEVFFEGRVHSYTCDPCAETIAKEREETDRRYRISQMETEWAAKCPSEFRLPEEFGGNTDLSRMEKEQPDWRKVLEWQFGRRGLLIRGESGTCKTRAMWRLLRKLWEQNPRPRFRVLTPAEFDRGYRDASSRGELNYWFGELANIHLLVIDDLGKASTTPGTESQLFDLIDRRTREGRPMIITTNDDGESLQSRMTENRGIPLIRRLRDYCDCIVFARSPHATSP